MRKIIITLVSVFLSVPLLSASDAAASPRVLRLPDVPATLTVPSDRLAFVLDNYWQHMPWSDAEAMADTLFIEQSAVDYFDLLTRADSTVVSNAYNRLIRAQSPAAGAFISRLAMQYLYSPDSPVFSPRTYEAVAQALLINGEVDPVRRLVLESDLANLAKNRPGTIAADFGFTDRDGKSHRLSEVVPKASQTLLFFYDPDCSTCQEVEAQMAADSRLNAQIAAGNIQVVAIDPYGSDPDRWHQHAATLPASWIVGFSPDGEVDNDELYVLLTSPTVYILDREGRVVREP